ARPSFRTSRRLSDPALMTRPPTEGILCRGREGATTARCRALKSRDRDGRTAYRRTIGSTPRTTLLGESTARIKAGVQAPVRPLSSKARLAVSLGVLASVLLGIAVVLFRPSATLNVVCRHDFRNLELTVAVDGDVVITETLTGSVKK